MVEKGTELHDLGLKKFHLYIDEEYSHFYAVKNENNGRGLRFALVGEDGKANKDLSIDCYWTFTIRKSKGEYYQLKEPILATKEKVDDVVFYTIFYPRLTTRIQGEARCQLTFINGNQVLMTKPYPFRVVEDLLDPDEIEIPDELLNVYERQLKEALEKTELKFNEVYVSVANELNELLNKGKTSLQDLVDKGEISLNSLMIEINDNIDNLMHNHRLMLDDLIEESNTKVNNTLNQLNESITEIVVEEVTNLNLLPRVETLESLVDQIKLSYQPKVIKDLGNGKQYKFTINNNRILLKEVK